MPYEFYDNGNKVRIYLAEIDPDTGKIKRNADGKIVFSDMYQEMTIEAFRVYKDVTNQFINIEEGLKEVAEYSEKLGKEETSGGIDFHPNKDDSGNNAYVDVSGSSADPVVWNISYEELCNLPVLNIKGLEKGKTLIINVTGLPDGGEVVLNPEIKIEGGAQNGEPVKDWDGNLIWNFGSFTGTIKTNNTWMGSMLVPKGSLDVGTNTNGSLIAETVTTRGESHKWDFRGFDETKVSGTKKWILPEGYKPEDFTIEVTLYRTYYEQGVQKGPEEIAPVSPNPLKITGDGSYLFDDLPSKYTEYDSAGNVTFTAYYRYSVKEKVVGWPEGVDPNAIILSQAGNSFINTLPDNGKTVVSGTKTWNVPDGTELPESITVVLYQNGEEYDRKTVTRKEGWSYRWDNLPMYDASGDPYVYTVDEPDVPENYTKSVQGYNIINERKGSLEVTKTFDGDLTAGDLTEAQKKAITFEVTGPDNFKATFSYAEMVNGKKEFTDLKSGIYTVTETNGNVDGYTVTTTYSVEDHNNVTVTDGVKTSVVVTNTYTRTGDLSVTKSVKGGDTEKDFAFTVTLSDTSINGTYGEMTFVNGVAHFTLRDGQTKTATGLPVGITYTVVEEKYENYTTDKVNAQGSIVFGEKAEVKFINTYNTIPEESTEETTEESTEETSEEESSTTETTEEETTTPDTTPETTPSYPDETNNDEGVLGSVRNQVGGVLGAMRGVLGAVRTGDDSMALVIIYIICIGMATAVIVAVVVRRRRRNEQG